MVYKIFLLLQIRQIREDGGEYRQTQSANCFKQKQ